MSRPFNFVGLLGAIGILASLLSPPAAALELFGITIPGTASAEKGDTLAYTVSLEVENDDSKLASSLSTASLLITQSKKGAADILALVARARADVKRLVAALYAEARYGGSIHISIAGQPIEQIRPEEIDATKETPVQVVIRIKPGPIFHFGAVSIKQSTPTTVQPPIEPQHYALVSGEPAKSEIIIAAIDKLVKEWRAAGYPFARIIDKRVAADHARSVVDVRLTVASGPPAVYGSINVTGARALNSKSIADQSGLKPGQSFNPADFKTTRERLRKFESIESVRIKEGDRVDANGGIPITLEVTERKPRFFGATASVSTIDGAEVQAYWGHRNVFGEGERLKVDASVSRLGAEAIDQLEFNVGAIYSKPGIFDIDTDLFSEIRFQREHPDTYESRSAKALIGVLHKFSDSLSGSLALEGQLLRVEDAFGVTDSTLIALPGELVYDTRDNRLDPSSGIAAMLRINPTTDLANDAVFVVSEAQIASYLALDEAQRAIFASRILAGSIIGASLADVPATSRFFAGGGGSVRGYEYRSLGPTIGGSVVGGLGIVGASAELRLRVTDQVGIVPFIDAAIVSDDSVPSFSEAIFVGAGIGIRYYTSLGPLRADAAVPLTNRDGQPKFGLYVGLGQAF